MDGELVVGSILDTRATGRSVECHCGKYKAQRCACATRGLFATGAAWRSLARKCDESAWGILNLPRQSVTSGISRAFPREWGSFWI